MSNNGIQVLVIGAGPAGLTAAYELRRKGESCIIIEADDVVGGISRTVVRNGWRFDIGGHRFFTKVPRVEAFWHEVLEDERFLLRPRMSRIFYRGKFFDYPLKASNALGNLGVIEAIRCVLSYVWVRIRPPKDLTSFEGWVASRFGWRLYRIFFKTYTEKFSSTNLRCAIAVTLGQVDRLKDIGKQMDIDTAYGESAIELMDTACGR